MNAIEIRDVSKRFGKVVALDKVTLDVGEGEIMGLLGPNGAGKTTLISIMIGLLSRDAGSVRILGRDIDRDLNRIKAQTNIVSGFSVVSAAMRVDEFLRYYAMLYNIPRRKERIREVLDLTGTSERKGQLVQDLSSGFKQRVLLAKALLNKPRVLFLDEPTVGLDVEIAVKIRALVKKLGKEGTTIIFTSHNLHEVEEVCGRVALITEGKIRHAGTVAELKKKTKDKITIEITCLEPAKAAKSIRRYAEKIHIEGATLFVDTKEKDQQRILDEVIASKAGLHSFTIVEPTLEDIFLELVRE